MKNSRSLKEAFDFYITQYGFEGNECKTPRTKIVHQISAWRPSGLFLIKMCPYLCSDLKATTYKLKKTTTRNLNPTVWCKVMVTFLLR